MIYVRAFHSTLIQYLLGFCFCCFLFGLFLLNCFVYLLFLFCFCLFVFFFCKCKCTNSKNTSTGMNMDIILLVLQLIQVVTFVVFCFILSYFFSFFFCFLLVSCCGSLAVMARYHIIHKISSFTLKLYMNIGGFVHHQYSINMINFITMINSASFILSLLEST